MTRREDAMVWFSAIEEKNYSKIMEMAATFQGSRDKYGDTGLMLAARQGDTKVIQILLPYEAGLANDDNQTALIVAALCDKAKACRFLVASEKDCLLCDGRDALMLAAQVGNTSAVDALVDHFPAIRDNNGTSALDYAAGEGYLECVQLIVKRQDLSPDDLEHAVNIAMARKHFDIVSYLNTVRNTMFKSSLGIFGDSSASDILTSTTGRTAKFASDTLDYFNVPKHSEGPMKLNRSVSEVSETSMVQENGNYEQRTVDGRRLVNSASSERGLSTQSSMHPDGLDTNNLRTTLSEAQRRVIQLTDTVNKIDPSIFNDTLERFNQCQRELEQVIMKNKELETLIITKDNEIRSLKEDLHFLLSARDEDNQLLTNKNLEISKLKEELDNLKLKQVEPEKTTVSKVLSLDKSVGAQIITRSAFTNTIISMESDYLSSQQELQQQYVDVATCISPQASITEKPTINSNTHILQNELQTAKQIICNLEETNKQLQNELLMFKTTDIQKNSPRILTSSFGAQTENISLESSIAIPTPVQPRRVSTSKIPAAPLSQVTTIADSLYNHPSYETNDSDNNTELERLTLENAQLTNTIQLLSEELIGIKDEKIQFEAEVERIVGEKDSEITRLTLLLDSLSNHEQAISCSTSMMQQTIPSNLIDRSTSAINTDNSSPHVPNSRELESSLKPFTPLLSNTQPHTITENQIKELLSERDRLLSLLQQKESESNITAGHHTSFQSCVEVQTNISIVDDCSLNSMQSKLSPPVSLPKMLQTSFGDNKSSTLDISLQTLNVESDELLKLKEEHLELIMKCDELRKKELVLEQAIKDNQFLTGRVGVYEEKINHYHKLLMEKDHEAIHLKQLTETLEIDRNTLANSYQELRAAFDELADLKDTQDTQINELKDLLSAQSQAFHAELDNKTRTMEGLAEDKHIKELQINTLEHKLGLFNSDMVNKYELDAEKMRTEELQSRINLLDQEILALKKDNFELTHDKKLVEESLMQIKQDLISKEVKLDSTLVLNEDLLTRLETANENIAASQSKIVELNSMIKILTVENNTMKNALDESKSRIEDLDNRLRHLSIEHSELLDCYTTSNHDLEQLRNENHKLSVELNRATLDAKRTLEEQTNRELMHLRSELEVKSLSIDKITRELSSTISSKEHEINELKQKVKKYKMAYLESKNIGNDTIKEATAQELAKYEHGIEIAHREVLELRVTNAELKAALEVMQARDIEQGDLKQKSKKYKDGYIKKCKQIEKLEHEIDHLKKASKTTVSQSRVLISADASTQTSHISYINKGVVADLVCTHPLDIEFKHDNNRDAIITDLNTRLCEQTQKTIYFKTRAKEHLTNYNIVRDELLSTREQLEAHIRIILEKENEIDGLKLLLSKLQGDSPELQKAMEDVALSAVYIDEDEYNKMVEQVNRSIETSLLNKSASLNTSFMANRSIGLSMHEKSFIHDDGLQSIQPQQICLMSNYTTNTGDICLESSIQNQSHDVAKEDRCISPIINSSNSDGDGSIFNPDNEIRNLQDKNDQLSAELSQVKEAYKALVSHSINKDSSEALPPTKLSTYTDLMTAVLKRDRVGLSVYIDQAGMTSIDGKTALMVAAECNNIDAVTRLLDIEGGMISKTGETALSISLLNSHFTIASLLVKKEGINVAGVSTLRMTRNKDTDSLATSSLSLTALATPDNGLTDLMMAVQRDDIVAVYCLLSLQAGLQDQNGYTALMYAAEKGSYPIVRILAELGNEAGKQNIHGGSALMLAARNGHLSICQFLADKECGLVGSPDSLLSPHHTALMLACFYGHLSIVRLLFPKEKSIVSASGKTVLSYARYPCSNVDFDTRVRVLAYVESNM